MNKDIEASNMPKEIVDIPLSEIEVSNLNVRKEGASFDIDDLAESIRIMGLLQPVLLMEKHGKGKYQLIVGQRRFLAHKKLKAKTIRAMVVKELSNNDAMIRSLVENVHRIELNHADAAKATTELYRRFGEDIKKVSKATGLSAYRIRQYVDIEALASEKTKKKLKAGNVTPTDVQRTLKAAQGNISKADNLLDLMDKYKPDKHQKNRLVEIGMSKPNASAKDIFDEALEPHVEESVMVPLPSRLRSALKQATKDLKKEAAEIATEALEHWLERNGYLQNH